MGRGAADASRPVELGKRHLTWWGDKGALHMSDSSVADFFGRQAHEARGPESERPTSMRGRRLRRIALATSLSLVVLAAGLVVAGYLTVNHYASSIPRVSGIVALSAGRRPVMPVASRRSMTVLLTSSGAMPGGAGVPSALIALVHFNAGGHGGAVVSIPANSLVPVPGHGTTQLWQALKYGGPSLLIETVEDLTNVRIDHYSVMNFRGAARLIGAMNGVNVDVPFPVTSDGYAFPAGLDHLTPATLLPYLRQANVSEVIRAELQGNLIRAMLGKIAADRMLVVTDVRLLHAMATALSVDSSFSDAQLESLGLGLGRLPGRDGVFITAPTTGGPDGSAILTQEIAIQLWSAIRNDAVAQFARRFPYTVTPDAPA
jgi:LCP family protein required for cell wall assembly